jgi:hypothetical protein
MLLHCLFGGGGGWGEERGGGVGGSGYLAQGTSNMVVASSCRVQPTGKFNTNQFAYFCSVCPLTYNTAHIVGVG